jgi:hypothetical protein
MFRSVEGRKLLQKIISGFLTLYNSVHIPKSEQVLEEIMFQNPLIKYNECSFRI